MRILPSLDVGDKAIHTILYEGGECLHQQIKVTNERLNYYRADVDGFQLKEVSHNRKWFVKVQAIFSGMFSNDWAVEIIASNLCQQLHIPCVLQKECEVYYGGKTYRGVYSPNFELDGYSFVSFESLLQRLFLSTRDDGFIRLNAMDKLEWCAKQLANVGGLAYEQTLKYMIDLAVIDCLVGNVDRHTRNFGLFYDLNEKCFMIPPLFDNGMGLFEHDYYRDNYKSYDEAMRSVYVAPYGEDPFELLEMIDERYGIRKLYPDVEEISYSGELTTPFALEYERRMLQLWQKFV